MKKMYLSRVAVVLLIIVILAGCGGMRYERIGNFTLVSTRNVDLSRLAEASKNLKARGVEGIYLIEGNDIGSSEGVNMAIEDAVNKASGDLMLNCVIYNMKKGKITTGYKVVGDVVETMEDKYGE